MPLLVLLDSQRKYTAYYPEILLTLTENWHRIPDVESWTVDIVFIAGHTFGFIILGVGYLKKLKATSRIIGFYYLTHVVFLVPFSTFTASHMLELYTEVDSSRSVATFEWLVKLLAALLVAPGLFFTLFFLFYDFKPLRESNLTWRLSNSPEFLRYSLAVVRAFLFTWGQI